MNKNVGISENLLAVICLGKDNSKLKEHFGSKVDMLYDTGSMEEAVRVANEISNAGDTVLLSPACASFDLFNNYEHRGECFRHEVKKLEDRQFKMNLLMF